MGRRPSRLIYKRGDTYYSNVRISGHPKADKRGRVRIPLDTDRDLAEQRVADLLAERANIKFGAGARDISWDAWREKYLHHSRTTKSLNTYKRDEASLNALEAVFPITRLSQFTPELLDRFKGSRMAAGKKPQTINRERGALVTMARTAERWKYLRPEDWRGVTRVKHVRKKSPAFFTFEEVRDRLLPAAGGRQWAVVATALGFYAGKRPAESYYTAWTDLDFKSRVVKVTAHEDVGFTPKDFEEREIPMADDLFDLLSSLPRRGRWVMGEERPAALNGLSVNYAKLVKKAGLAGNLNKLRHSFGSYLVMADVNLIKVRDLMGHSTVKTTEIYAALIPSSLEDAVRRLPKGLLARA